MADTLKQLNMRVPDAVHIKLEELAKHLSLTKTGALITCVNELYDRRIAQKQPPPPPPAP